MANKLENEVAIVTGAAPGIGRLTTLLIAIVGLTTFAAIVGGIAVVSGQTPTPTESPTTSATPTATAGPTASPDPAATPYPQTTITIRFVRNGQPVIVTILPERTAIVLGGGVDFVDCSQHLSSVTANVSEYKTAWPKPLNQGFPPDCSKGPPTTMRFSFLTPTRHLNPFGIVVTWTGSEIVADLEVPADIPLVSPSPVVAPQPASVPSTGGQPHAGGIDPLLIAVAATAVAVAIVSGYLVITRRSDRWHP